MFVIGNIFYELVSMNKFKCLWFIFTHNLTHHVRFSAMIAFDLDPDLIGNATLLGENNIPISEDKFPVIVRQYLSCGHFCIKIAIKSDANEPFIVQVLLKRTSPCKFIPYALFHYLFLFLKDLKYFLMKHGCRSIFLEAARDENENGIGIICEESVQFVVENLMDYITQKYSIHKWDEIEDVCNAAVCLFPSIEKVIAWVIGSFKITFIAIHSAFEIF